MFVSAHKTWSWSNSSRKTPLTKRGLARTVHGKRRCVSGKRRSQMPLCSWKTTLINCGVARRTVHRKRHSVHGKRCSQVAVFLKPFTETAAHKLKFWSNLSRKTPHTSCGLDQTVHGKRRSRVAVLLKLFTENAIHKKRHSVQRNCRSQIEVFVELFTENVAHKFTNWSFRQTVHGKCRSVHGKHSSAHKRWSC